MWYVVRMPSVQSSPRSSVSTSAGLLNLLLEQSQDISLQLRSDVPVLAEALASLRRAYKEH
jgi:hypothetical protein